MCVIGARARIRYLRVLNLIRLIFLSLPFLGSSSSEIIRISATYLREDSSPFYPQIKKKQQQKDSAPPFIMFPFFRYNLSHLTLLSYIILFWICSYVRTTDRSWSLQIRYFLFFFLGNFCMRFVLQENKNCFFFLNIYQQFYFILIDGDVYLSVSMFNSLWKHCSS